MSSSDIPNEKEKFRERALDYHRGSGRPAGFGDRRPGKLEISATKSLVSQRELSFAYSPGVAEPCKEIAKDPLKVFEYTAKGNLVAVISNGTAVLGLGNIGPLASKPVMEGKAVLFKKFADLDCFDIEVNSSSNEHFIETVAALEPTFGGINLEDIKAPDCFVIEKALRERIEIPVFHDDQHGTAIISGAALVNALEITKRKVEDVRVVFIGGGAASIACARFWLSLGVRKENCIMADHVGVIRSDRTEMMNPSKEEFSVSKTWHKKLPSTVAEALVDADILMGCSAGGIVTGEMLKGMRKKPIVFAMANPDPEISYEDALASRDDLIFATGRSDYPNQVNNVLCYPFMFRGALDVRAKTINEEMKIAAAKALATLAKEPVPDSVVNAYGGKPISYGREYIIPKPFDPRVLLWVAPAVADAAVKTGVAREEIPGGSLAEYVRRLESLLGKRRSIMADLRGKITAYNKSGKRKIRIAFPEAENEKVLQAAEILRAEGIAEPVLIGNKKRILPKIEELLLGELEGAEIIRPSKSNLYETYADEHWRSRQRKGLTRDLALQQIKDPFYFGAMMVKKGDADILLGGITRPYRETLLPSLQVVGAQKGRKLSGVYMAIWKQRVIFIGDPTVNVDPSSEDLADIAINTANVAAFLGFDPRVAMLSFSNFGSNDHPEALKVREAVKQVRLKRPDLIIDGEVQADTAVNPKLFEERYDFSPLKERGANVLICPNLASANISYKLLGQLGGAELVGPILVGMNKPIHVMQTSSTVNEIVNMALIAILDAQRRGLHQTDLGKVLQYNEELYLET
jgi:malate dehydrogenase (oxaloacetate-decarboxylating)(NADP+)